MGETNDQWEGNIVPLDHYSILPLFPLWSGSDRAFPHLQLWSLGSQTFLYYLNMHSRQPLLLGLAFIPPGCVWRITKEWGERGVGRREHTLSYTKSTPTTHCLSGPPGKDLPGKGYPFVPFDGGCGGLFLKEIIVPSFPDFLSFGLFLFGDCESDRPL